MAASVLVISAGTSSVKFQLFAAFSPDRVELCTKGQIDGIGTRPRLQAKNAAGRTLVDQQWSANDVRSIQNALDRSIPFLREQVGGKLPVAVGHRVVHGGPDYDAPVLVDDTVLKRLEELAPLSIRPHSRANRSHTASRSPSWRRSSGISMSASSCLASGSTCGLALSLS